MPGVDTEVGDAHESGQGVHGPGSFPGELVPGGKQDLGRCPELLVHPRGAQLLLGVGKHGRGDAAGVDRVGLADVAAACPAHPGRFDGPVAGKPGPVAGKPGLAGELGPVGADALDDPQGSQVAAGAPCDPGDRAGPAGVGVGEGLRSQVLTGGGEHGVGVGFGVGVHADDERMSMRDYGAHSVRFLSSQGR